jgi:FKBP-type peptidyl-prolyl cis-trans isomerase SlyD
MSEAPSIEEQVAKDDSEQAITMNKVVSFHYRLAEVGEDGERADWREESHGSAPLFYLHGFHNVVVGLEKALEGKKIGDAIEITLQPDDAYGYRRPNSTQRVPIKHLQFPGPVKKILPGMPASVETNQGERAVVILKV